MAHIVNRLQLHVRCTNEDDAFNIRQHFAITHQQQLMDAIDSVCTQYSNDNDWTRINKIEIDLGRLSPVTFDEEFAPAFKINFEKELKQKLLNISPAQKKSSTQLSKASLFKYFLLNGNLPWWADESFIDFEEIIMDVLANQPALVKQFFYQHRQQNNIWLRAAFQFSAKVKSKIILLIDELNIVRNIFIIWSQLLNEELAISDDIILKNASHLISNIENADSLLITFQTIVIENFGDKKNIIEKAVESKRHQLIQSAQNILYRQASLIDEHIKNNTANKESLEDISDTNADKYAVKYAGIILAAPFLKTFFSNLKLLLNGKWLNKDAQYKAIHLLRYLCTGLQQTQEYNLTHEKIICGCNMEEPIPLEIALHETEINEATSLLESMLEHWKSLKNTSINGLRETFLKRDGLLSKKDNGWLLQVERKTLDVLLDSIPWGYSINNFSWNDYTIFSEW